MSDLHVHRIDDCLSDEWLDAWTSDVVSEVETYLRKQADFHAFLGEDD
jgi:hypothetical protein